MVSPVDSDNNPATVMRMGDGINFRVSEVVAALAGRFWPAWNRFEFE